MPCKNQPFAEQTARQHSHVEGNAGPGVTSLRGLSSADAEPSRGPEVEILSDIRQRGNS